MSVAEPDHRSQEHGVKEEEILGATDTFSIPLPDPFAWQVDVQVEVTRRPGKTDTQSHDQSYCLELELPAEL